MTAPPSELCAALVDMAALLRRLDHPRAGEVEALAGLCGASPQALWPALNGNGWWAGAGSLAAETLADNPGLPDALWQQEVRAFREQLIVVGEALMARGGENPGVQSWIMAFRNWNAAGV